MLGFRALSIFSFLFFASHGEARQVHLIGRDLQVINQVERAAVSSDFKTLAVALPYDSKVLLFNLDSGHEVGMLEQVVPSQIASLQFSPSGRYLVAKTNRGFFIFDRKEKLPIHPIGGNSPEPAVTTGFSKDEKIFYTAYSRSVSFYTLPKYEYTHQIESSNRFRSFFISPLLADSFIYSGCFSGSIVCQLDDIRSFFKFETNIHSLIPSSLGYSMGILSEKKDYVGIVRTNVKDGVISIIGEKKNLVITPREGFHFDSALFSSSDQRFIGILKKEGREPDLLTVWNLEKPIPEKKPTTFYKQFSIRLKKDNYILAAIADERDEMITVSGSGTVKIVPIR